MMNQYIGEPYRMSRVRRMQSWTTFLLVLALLLLVGPSIWERWSPFRSRGGELRPVTARGELADFEKMTIEIFESNQASVVSVLTYTEAGSPFASGRVLRQGSGSGFIWNELGYVVTNYHVVADVVPAKRTGGSYRFDTLGEIQVTMYDRKAYPAEFVGASPDHDLAVLRIHNPPLSLMKEVKLGRSYTLKVGQAVFAIGSPFDLDQTLTTGVVSALGRKITSPAGVEIRDVVQTDAAINPGNSGGPLLDSAGLLIGVNTAIEAPDARQNAGIGFAIPVDTVNWVVADLIRGVDPGELKPQLGVYLESEHTNRRFGGAVIKEVIEGSVAAKAGLQGTRDRAEGWGDVIIRIDDTVIHDFEDLSRVITSHDFGDEIVLHYLRGGEEHRVSIVLTKPGSEQ